MLKSADNPLHTLYSYRTYKHVGKAFLFFNHNKKNFVSYRIRKVSRSQINKNEVDMIGIIAK